MKEIRHFPVYFYLPIILYNFYNTDQILNSIFMASMDGYYQM